MDSSITQFVGVLAPVAVPYVTAAIKWAWALIFNAMPRWMGPLKAIVAGWIVAAFSRAVGIPLPTDLGAITDSQTASILTSGVVLGALGALIRNFFDALKKQYGQETTIGKVVRGIAGAAVVLLVVGLASVPAQAKPYLELRYTLLGNIPSVIGDVSCPCIGSEAIAGWTTNPSDRWLLDVSAGANFQTRWDDPESYRFAVRSEYALGSAVSWLLGYEQRHNFDRSSQIPDEYLDYRGRHQREAGNFLWGISGLRYAWTGVRITFP